MNFDLLSLGATGELFFGPPLRDGKKTRRVAGPQAKRGRLLAQLAAEGFPFGEEGLELAVGFLLFIDQLVQLLPVAPVLGA